MGKGWRYCIHHGGPYRAEKYDDVCPICTLKVATDWHKKEKKCPVCHRELKSEARRKGEG